MRTREPAIGEVRSPSGARVWLFACICALTVSIPRAGLAQAGPPFLTNDPGTPGNGDWEINVAAAPTVERSGASYQAPQLDLNYGVGDRLQLTYEVSYVLETADGASDHSGWSNGYLGAKWRFVDQGEDGWKVSIFPQAETGSTLSSQQRGISSPGPRLLVPVQAATKLGPVDVDMEAGYYFPKHGAREEFFGLVADHGFTDRFDLAAELYRDHPLGPQSNSTTTLDLGGRYELKRGLIALFMAGRGLDGGPQYIGYFGIQILLSDYGRTLGPPPGGS
jgi:hypothetical protein